MNALYRFNSKSSYIDAIEIYSVLLLLASNFKFNCQLTRQLRHTQIAFSAPKKKN